MTENIDAAEVAKFAEVADKWWDLNGEFKPLHDLNPTRVNYIHQHVNLVGKKVLDVGCGGGILAEALAHRGATVAGLDVVPESIAVAKEHARQESLEIEYHCETVETFSEKQSNAFDVVTCMEMLEHVPDPESIVQSCAKLVKPGGHLFFSTINRNPKSYMLAIVGAEYLLNLVPRGTHDYKKLIKPSELGHWIRNADCELVELKGLRVIPFINEFRLSDDTDVNYFVYARRPV